MEPIYQKNDTVIAIHSGYINEGDYLLKNTKNSKLALRRLIINNDRVTMFPLNPNNKIHDITRYISKDEFDSKYEIIGKIKRHIRDFD
jgi:SOS-response transcriptional repressor LexA